jgi:hypothetical protein
MRSFAFNLLLLLALAACTAQTVSTEPSIPTEAHSRPDLFPAQLAAVSLLSRVTGLPPEQITVISTKAVDWPDGCLGVVRIGVMCAQGIVPGYQMILEADGQQYEYHTNLDGSVIVPLEGEPVSGSAQDAAITQLAFNLGVEKSDIILVSSSEIQWNDSCLGVALEGVMCAQGLVNGYLIVLENGGHQFEYHTNNDGSRILPATPAMDWREQGGEGNTCGSITVYLSGEVYGYDCYDKANTEMGSLAALLSPEERARFYMLVDTFGNSIIDISDPENVTDRMIRQMSWYGKGNRLPSPGEQQMLFSLGSTMYENMQK